MSFPSYPEYKKSNTDFIGQVPAHWKLERLKHCAEVFPSNVDKKSVDGQIPVKLCNYTDVYYNDTIGCELGFMLATATKEQVKRFELQQGDVVFTKDSESADDIGVAAYVSKRLPGVVYGYHLSIARANGAAIGEFLKLYFDSQETKSYFAVSANGLTRVGLGQYAVDNAPIALPSVEEQTQIARFLDHETAKIDALICEQERLIALLQEKRQGVISHAVTKGLDPSVPMKDSGVEWLGEVPEHWRVVQLRHLLQMIEQGRSPECESRAVVGEEWGVLRTSCVNGGIYRSAEHKALPAHITPHSEYEVKEGDLLMSRASGSKDLIGAVAYVEKTPSRLLLSDKVFRLKLEQGVHPQNFTLLMGSQNVRAQIELAINGAEGLANNITKESIKSFVVALPAYEEQQDIFKYLSLQSHKFSELSEQLLAALAVLKERRATLISAAVTGKIDVRNWQPPVHESAYDEDFRQAGMEATA